MTGDPRTICVVCGGDRFKQDRRQLLRCLECAHVVAEAGIRQLDFKDIYADRYFTDGEYLDYWGDRSCFEKNFQARLKDLRRFQPDGRLLEIGAAAGFFLNLAREFFVPAGYEICARMADAARTNFALDVRSTDFMTDEWPQQYFDAVVMWDVIEHLPDPQDVVAKAHRLLKDAGVLVLTTGDISSIMARLQGRHWRLIHYPTHLHYFSRDSMRRLLDRHQFDIVSITYPGYWRSLRQMAHGLLARSTGGRRVVDYLRHRRVGKVPVYINLFDIMQVIARKRSPRP